ncbi:MAG: hypothetical protein Roseis2KO_56950 [Roseivirga sp.]
MLTRVVRILTICLFSCLVGVFVAYKSGYFSAEKPSLKTDPLLVQPLVQNPIEPSSKTELDMTDSAFIIASSTKSAVAIDYSLIDVLKELPSAHEQVDPAQQNNDNKQNPDDVIMSSSKVIIPTDKSDLALDLKTAFTTDWRRVFGSLPVVVEDSLHIERDTRFDAPPPISLDHIHLQSRIQTQPMNLNLDPVIQNNLASSSKSIVIIDEAASAENLRYLIGKGWREAFGLSKNLDEDDLIAQDPVSLEMVRKIDSISFDRSMMVSSELMASSKSMVWVNQVHLADSLMNIMKKALRLRIDSLRKKD